jgi:kynurenine formamidase
MNRIIDLTMTLRDGMLVFPGDPAPEFAAACRYENGYFVSKVTLGTHTGTHIDAPVHRIQGAETITDLKPEAFIGWKTLIMDLPQAGRGNILSRADCAAWDRDIEGCDGVLFKTGWGRHAGQPAYYDGFPGIDESVVDWLLEHSIHLIALESPSVHSEKHLEIHEKLLKNDILIIEGLVNTGELTTKYIELHAVPLKFDRLDGSPVRAYGVERR